ncbi:MAG: hypothetical protein JXL84_11335 [Deltaproteobacteria bacterium]|nr:hypothetical protein [Deltaproteobacteria bacterium]
MKIEELIAGKTDNDRVDMQGLTLPVSALNQFVKQGYENILVYRDNQTFSLWGKNCSACFTPEHLNNLT